MTEDRENGHTRSTGQAEGADWRTAARFSALTSDRRLAGRFEILERLGHGGAGEVFLCHDELAGGNCAIKVLYPGPQRPPLARLRRELRLVRKIGHPGIVQVHDIGEADGLLYLVMEYVAGQTLAARLNQVGRLPADEAERIVRAVLEALGAAHDVGVVHRDVKPANVLLADDGKRVVLLDFGLAWHPVEPTLTKTGGIVGTPQYMSPEQASGSGPIGAASDLYAVGIVLWEMLTGAPPFDSDSAMEVLTAHSQRPLPAPQRKLRGVPARLQALVLRLLEKRPQRRPPTAHAAVAVLGASPWRLRAHRLIRSLVRREGVLFRLGLAVSLILGMGALLLYPARASRELHAVHFDNVFGIRLWTQEFELSVHDVGPFEVPGVRTPRYVAALAPNWKSRRLNTPEYASGLVALDPIRRTQDTIEFTGSIKGSFPTLPGFDAAYGVTLPRRLPWGLWARPAHAIVFQHYGHYPAGFAVLDDTGFVGTMFQHPGHISAEFQVVEGDDNRSNAIVFSAMNNLMGTRPAVFAVTGSVVDRGKLGVPPYTGPLGDSQPINWYTLLGDGQYSAHLTVGDSVRFTIRDREFRLGIDDGVPLDESDREMLNHDEWRDDRESLLDEVMRAADLERKGRSDFAAQRLENLADNTLRVSVHRGVALGRAAELYRNDGRFDKAASVAGRASLVEPRIPGHYRIQIDAVARSGDGAALEAIDRESGLTTFHGEVRRDLLFAWLVLGDTEAAKRVAGSYLPDRELYYGSFGKGVLALHEGDPESAMGHFIRVAENERYPEFRFLIALSLALYDDPNFEGIRRYLDPPEIANAVGQVFPVEGLRQFVALRSGSLTAVQREPLLRELAFQQEAAKNDLVDLYLLGLGQVLVEALVGEAIDTSGERRDLADVAKVMRESKFAGLVHRQIDR